jgi:hypothetical protein
MRSPLWFVVVVAIAVASIVAAALYAMPRLDEVGSDMTRVVVPGSAVLALDKPGDYVVYHERNSTVDGRYYASTHIDGLQLRLSTDSGAEVRLGEPKYSGSYSIGNRSGVSIYGFTIDRPGRYRLVASLESGRNEPKAVLAIGQGTVWSIFRLILGTLAIAFGGIGVAAALLFVVLWRRSKAAKAIQG